MRRKRAVMSTGSVAFLAANVVAGVSGQPGSLHSPRPPPTLHPILQNTASALTLLKEIAPRATRAATPPGSYDSFTACSAAASFIESRAILKQDFAMRGVIRLCALAMPYALAGRTPKVTPNNCPPSIVCRRRQMGASRRANGGRGVSTVAGDNVISPMPIALVEGR
jgi:hypothetical protein